MDYWYHLITNLIAIIQPKLPDKVVNALLHGMPSVSLVGREQ